MMMARVFIAFYIYLSLPASSVSAILSSLLDRQKFLQVKRNYDALLSDQQPANDLMGYLDVCSGLSEKEP